MLGALELKECDKIICYEDYRGSVLKDRHMADV